MTGFMPTTDLLVEEKDGEGVEDKRGRRRKENKGKETDEERWVTGNISK